MTRCRHCGASWHGTGIAHCATCHATFTTPNNFDRHRAGNRTGRTPGTCHNPTDSGLVQNDRGYWAQPGRDSA